MRYARKQEPDTRTRAHARKHTLLLGLERRRMRRALPQASPHLLTWSHIPRHLSLFLLALSLSVFVAHVCSLCIRICTCTCISGSLSVSLGRFSSFIIVVIMQGHGHSNDHAFTQHHGLVHRFPLWCLRGMVAQAVGAHCIRRVSATQT